MWCKGDDSWTRTCKRIGSPASTKGRVSSWGWGEFQTQRKEWTPKILYNEFFSLPRKQRHMKRNGILGTREMFALARTLCTVRNGSRWAREKLRLCCIGVLCASGLKLHPGQWEAAKVLEEEIKLAAGCGWIGDSMSGSGRISWNTPSIF